MTTPTPQSRVEIDPNYERQLRKREDGARAAYEARQVGDSPRWGRPKDWNGDVFDYAGVRKALDRDQANGEVIDAIKDGSATGTTSPWRRP